ncbi:MAG TPA: AAA family ATPase, partial [Solirubrobacterales bacterium]
MAALLERERELGEIEAALGEVGAGKGCAIGIEASAGLGKTRLLQEAREVAASAGLNVLSARATELEREFPFALVRQLFEPQLAALSAGERDELFEGATAAKGALGLDPNGESGYDAFAVLHGLYWVTAALAERRPLLLAVDDAHTADAASLDFLGFLLPRLEELPVLLVIANRPDEPDPTEGLRRVLTDPAMHHLAPRPLSAEATSMLLGEGLGRQPDQAFAAACHEVSGGNPFLLSELVQTLAERKIEPVADQADLVGELAPDRVAQTVLPRIERLAPEAAAVARALTILGEGADVRLVAELASLASATARVVADELRAAAILDSGASLRFIHPLVRNAVYADIPAGERARCHALAATLLRQDGAPLAQVATQLLASEPEGDRETVATLIDAGEGALVTGAPRSAIAYLRRAIDEPPPEDLRAAVLEPLITACFRAVDHQAWAEAEPHVLAELEREPSLRSRWATPLTWVMAMSGRFEEAASMLVQAVEVTIAEDDVESAFQLEAQLNTLGQMVPSGVPEVDLSRYLDKIDPDSPGGRLAAVIEARAAAVSGGARDAAAAAKRALANDAVIFAEEPELASSFIAVSILVIADELDFAAHAAERS